MPRLKRRISTSAALAMIALPTAGGSADEAPLVRYPDPDGAVRTLETRKTAQLRTKDQFPVFLDFAFRDRQPSTGVDFEHRSVEDSLKNWMPVHYDHGNGVAVADVDGDGRHDLYLVTQLGGNRLYRNLGGGRFEDTTERAGVALADRVGVTASFADVDNDGDPDLFVTTVRGGNALFRNDGEGKFTDVTREAGVAYSGHSSGAVFFDYDNDGWLDLFLTNVGVYTTDKIGPGGFYRGIDDAFKGHVYPERTEPSILYRNLGEGRFEEASAAAGLDDTSWSGDATAVDLNGDRFPDLYVLNMQGDDHYYENVEREGGRRFVERTADYFPKTSWGAMGVGFFDYNNDGRMDLYVTDMHSDMHDEPVDPLRTEKVKFDLTVADGENNLAGNAFYEQKEDGTFEEISDLVRAENFWPWGLSVADLNADGWQDVFVTASMNYPFRYGVNTVLMNNRGRTFFDAEFILGVEPRRGGRTHRELFTLACGGDDQGHRLCAERSGPVRVEGALGTRASAVFDLDGDGDLDVVTNEFNDVPQVLVSDLAERTEVNALVVELEGTRSNRDGLGARVRVWAGDDIFTRYHDGKSGYLAQSSLPLYFGLGDHREVKKVEVLWPAGGRQVVTEGISLDRPLTLVESADE